MACHLARQMQLYLLSAFLVTTEHPLTRNEKTFLSAQGREGLYGRRTLAFIVCGLSPISQATPSQTSKFLSRPVQACSPNMALNRAPSVAAENLRGHSCF